LGHLLLAQKEGGKEIRGEEKKEVGVSQSIKERSSRGGGRLLNLQDQLLPSGRERGRKKGAVSLIKRVAGLSLPNEKGGKLALLPVPTIDKGEGKTSSYGKEKKQAGGFDLARGGGLKILLDEKVLHLPRRREEKRKEPYLKRKERKKGLGFAQLRIATPLTRPCQKGFTERR